MKRYWVIAPYSSKNEEGFEESWSFDLKNSVIAIGWSKVGDVSRLSDNELMEKLKKEYPDKHAQRSFNTLKLFYSEIKENDIIIARKGRKTIVGIGEVTGKAFYDLNMGKERFLGQAEWLYTRALLSFVKKGDSAKTNNDLKTALESNRYVPEYLTGKKPIPRFLPDRITMRGEDEGFCYASRYLKAWKKVSGAIDWLKEKAGIKIIPKARRNESCPCRSGKKYKKCCGA